MRRYYLLILSVIFLFSTPTIAQEKWAVEFRPGLNFPTSDVGDTDADIGYGFEITGAYKIMPHLAFYAGWGFNQFRGDDVFTHEDITLLEKGFTFGFQINRPIGTSSFSYLARAGAIYNRIELENIAGDITADTEYGFGWQLAVGIDYELASKISLRPMLRYRSISTDIEVENVSTETKLNYFSFGIGLGKKF